MKILSTVYILFISVVMLTSCSMFSPVKTETDTTYQLNKIPYVPTKKPHRAMTLLVLPTESNPIYNSTQMIYSEKPYQTAYFTKNRWSAAPASMLQPLLIETLQNTHYFSEVVSPPYAGTADYALSTQLLELQQDFSCSPSIIYLTVRAQLTNMSSGKVIAAKQFAIAQPAPENTPYGGVIAANQATARLLQKIVAFSMKAK